MHGSKHLRALSVIAVAAVAQAALSAAPAPAQAAAAVVTSINPVRGTAGVLVAVDGTGCVTPGGQPTSTAELFVRGPGPSTARTTPVSAGLGQTQFAVGTANGGFLGLVQIPTDAATGSTYMLSAQCIAQGRPQGPESAGFVFTVTGPAPAPRIDTGTATPTGVPPSNTGTTTGGNPAVPGPVASPGGFTTTSRATPIAAQPHFTG